MAQDKGRNSNSPTLASVIVSILAFPFQLLMNLTKVTLAILCLVLLLISIALPIATTMSQGLYSVASTVAEAMFDAPSLLTRASTKTETKLAQKEAALAAERAAAKEANLVASKTAADLDAAILRAAKAQVAEHGLRGKVATLETDIDAAVLRAAKAEVAEHGLGLKVQSLEAELATKAEARVVYRNEKRLLSEAVADASTRVAGRLKTMLGTDISSMAGQAIPYVGAVAIVGSVGYDAYQSCEMIKDLHELDVAFNPDDAIETREVCGMKVPTAAEIWEKAKNAPDLALTAVADAIPDFDVQAGWQSFVDTVPSPDDLAAAADNAANAFQSVLP
ncbi:MAG: hypothetical protein ABIV25_15940 [Paracoccaceae bacterium]